MCAAHIMHRRCTSWRSRIMRPTAVHHFPTCSAQKEKGPETEPVFGRYGLAEKRTNGEIGIHAVRGGTVTGEHEVGFYGSGEQVILTHRAENRALFAQGALKAARYLLDKPAGLYSMRDVVREMLG